MRDKFIFCFIILSLSTCLKAQCELNYKQSESGDIFYILKDCGKGKEYVDEVTFFPPMIYPKFIVANDGALYHTWVFKGFSGDNPTIQKIVLKKNKKLLFEDPYVFTSEQFNETLKEGNCLKLQKDGLLILFKNENIEPYFISYELLDSGKLDTVLAERKENDK